MAMTTEQTGPMLHRNDPDREPLVGNIKVTREAGDVDHYFLDAEYYVPLQAAHPRKADGDES